MLRRPWILLVAGGLALVAVPLTSSSPLLKRPGTIRITDVEVKRRSVDIGAAGRTPGDVLVITHLLFNKRITPKPLGHSEALCTFLGRGDVLGAGSSSCSVTFFLPKGRIMASGVIHSRLFYELAVTGGTGLYNNVRGTLTVTSLGRNPPQELLLFRLVV